MAQETLDKERVFIAIMAAIEKLLQENTRTANVKIVCADGDLMTHKVLVASCSEFLCRLLREAAGADEITIMLPDFDKWTVKEFLKNCFASSSDKSELSSHSLQLSRLLNGSCVDKQEEEKNTFIENIQCKDEEDHSYEDDVLDDKQDYDDERSEELNTPVKLKIRSQPRTTPRAKRGIFYKTKMRQNTNHNIDDILDRIRENQDAIIKEPSNKSEEKMNSLLDKKIRYDQAIADMLR